MNVPDRLTPPHLSAYPFINLVYEDKLKFENRLFIAHECPMAGLIIDDEKFSHEHFPSAELVTTEYFAPLDSMSDHTFSKLIGHFDLTINSIKIKKKGDLLEAVTLIESSEDYYAINPMHLPSPVQISAWLLNAHARQASIHWGLVTELYNESERDQQEAILQFFSKCLNRSLVDLLEVKGPTPIPESMRACLDTKVVDGMPYVLSEEGEWIREDLSTNLYTVNGFRSLSRDNTYMIAGASTFEEVVGYASRYVLDMEAKDTIQYVAIFHRGEEVCSAKLIGMGPPHENSFYHSLPVRIGWDLDTPMKKDKLEGLLIKAEKKMGLQWSKVQKLEDELGL